MGTGAKRSARVKKAKGRRARKPGGGAPRSVLRDLGAHVSVAGGLDLCFERADGIGARTVQICCKNQRQWKGRPFGDYEVGCFKRSRRNSRVYDVVAHGTYLVNLATEDEDLRTKSINCLGYELSCVYLLGLGGLVVHPGSNENGLKRGIERIISSIEEAFANPVYAGAALLLETTAGQGNAVGWRLEQLQAILKGLKDSSAERVGICLDTCHLHAAGYDVRTRVGWRDLVAELDERFGLERIRCIHVNDSQQARGSRVDRHANIGEGTIGLRGFSALLAEKALWGIPKILETPIENDGHKRDLKTLRRLAPRSTP